MNLPALDSLQISGKKVIVRCDLDVGENLIPEDENRLKTAVSTLNYLAEHSAKTVIIGHRGRPASAEASARQALSLKPVAEHLGNLLGKPISFSDDWEVNGDLVMLENLRFDPGEEGNSPEFAQKLASFGDFYVNEAFGVSHRQHASIVGLAKLLPHAAGLHFAEEVKNLAQVLDQPKRPVVVILGGAKKDKLDYVSGIKKFADKLLIGGRLPEYLGDEALVSVRNRAADEAVIVGNLMMDKEDITLNTIERFESEIKKAGTIVLGGPMGMFEDGGHGQGTERVFRAVSEAGAFKVAGGGDTEAAINSLGLGPKFDWISVGGGAMLKYLSCGTLPGIEALLG